MKPASDERARTMRVWRDHLAGHGPRPVECICELQVGRFRKGRAHVCRRARCFLRHGDKLLNIPMVHQRRGDVSSNEQLRELEFVFNETG